jgi:hypothetical protein
MIMITAKRYMPINAPIARCIETIKASQIPGITRASSFAASMTPAAVLRRDYFGASEATILSKRGSSRNGSQRGCKRSSP